MANLYEQLEAMTVIVADTGDIDSIETFKPRDATTNPSLITKAAKMPKFQGVVDDALRWAAKETGDGASEADVVGLAIDRLAVGFGLKILEIIEGRVSTEVDARLSYDEKATVEKARFLIGMYEDAGVSRDRVLIKIASTWEGIRAAETLEKEGIHCNLTLLFGMHQAVACAEAGVTLISPFVGRILDWYKADTGRDGYPADEDPGVLSVTGIFHYFKRHGHKTEIMGASFRNLGEITQLAGCDLLTIAPKFLSVLRETEGKLPRKLNALDSPAKGRDKIEMNLDVFRKMHAADRMATDKLAQGIEGFSKALVNLEELLAARLKELD